MIHNTCFVVPYLLFILNIHILPMENHCILFVLYTYSLDSRVLFACTSTFSEYLRILVSSYVMINNLSPFLGKV